MTSPDNELILRIGYGVDNSIMPVRNSRSRRFLSVTEFTIPGVEDTYPTDLGDITVLYVRTDEYGQTVRVGLEGDVLKGRVHGRRHGHRKPYFEDQIEVQLGKKLREELYRGAQALSKRETIFVSASRANS